MIKRRFYRQEHGDGDDASDSSSSSSDSELEADATEETEARDDVDDVPKVRGHRDSYSSSSGYGSEDSLASEFDVDSSGLLTNDDDTENVNAGQNIVKSRASSKSDVEIADKLFKSAVTKDSVPNAAYVLKCKSTFKCRLCPRIVCLTEDTLKAHLKSKRHTRSEKLLSEGRLKLMLTSDGEIEEEEEGETHAERHARTVAAAQSSVDPKKKNKGRQRQRRRLKKKKEKDLNLDKARQSTKSPAKKRYKIEN